MRLPTTITTTMRLPLDVKAFLEEEAQLNSSSQNSEIVRAIRDRMQIVREREAKSEAA